jgi:hypothetical protein
MSEESKPEGAEHQQELEESALESESGDSEASPEDPAQAAMIKRYGFTPQQAEESKLYL